MAQSLDKKTKQVLTSIRKPISHSGVPKTNAAETCEHHEVSRSNEATALKSGQQREIRP